MICVTEAIALINSEARSFGVERILLDKAFGRVLAQDAVADRDYPPFNRSAMDGFAVISNQFSIQQKYRTLSTVFAGDKIKALHFLQDGDTIKIMTGAAVPPPFDAVIRREDAIDENGIVEFMPNPVDTWKNISRQGEDIKRKEKISLKGRVVDNATASLLASFGIVKPQVYRLPRVAIISTGNEIIPPEKKPNPVQIRNSNVFALKQQLHTFGITQVTHIHVSDNPQKLLAAINRCRNADILLMTGGVSVGDSDYVPAVLEKQKFKNIFHKVKIKPGKPLWFGRRGKTVVFAIPGNPFSAQVIFRIFVVPYLRKCFNLQSTDVLALPLSSVHRKKDTLENYFPAKLDTPANSISTVSAIPFNGSGDIRAALFSDGIAMHPAEKAELGVGSVVNFYPWGKL